MLFFYCPRATIHTFLPAVEQNWPFLPHVFVIYIYCETCFRPDYAKKNDIFADGRYTANTLSYR